jgi:hypothetical protein
MVFITLLHKNATGLASTSDKADPSSSTACTTTVFPIGMVIDGACDVEWLNHIEDIRASLPLDSKRPTVDRRFFADHSERRTIVGVIEDKVKDAIMTTSCQGNYYGKKQTDSVLLVHCNNYLRILEYSKPGSGLAPHTDGTKVCERVGHKSTHTLLLFLSDCPKGGETVLLDGKVGWSAHQQVVVPPERVLHPNSSEQQLLLLDMTDGDDASNVSVGVSPQIGRILFFPHEWPHAGAVCESVPKVMLRAELTVQWTSHRKEV